MNEWITQKIQQVISSDQTGNKPVPCRFVQGTCHWLTCGVMYRSSHALGCSLPLPPVLHKFQARELILRLKSCASLNRCHFSKAESDSTLAVPYTGSGVSSCMLSQAIYNVLLQILLEQSTLLQTYWLFDWWSWPVADQWKMREVFFSQPQLFKEDEQYSWFLIVISSKIEKSETQTVPAVH